MASLYSNENLSIDLVEIIREFGYEAVQSSMISPGTLTKSL